MTGRYKHTVDSKSRLSLPARLREKLGETVYLLKGPDKCVTVYSVERWVEFTQKMKVQTDAKTRALQRAICASAACVDLDAQGRITVPQELRTYAQLENEVIIVGIIDRAEIWNPDRWQVQDDNFTADDLTDAMIASGL